MIIISSRDFIWEIRVNYISYVQGEILYKLQLVQIPCTSK